MDAAPATQEPTDDHARAQARAPRNSFPRFMSVLHKPIDYGQRLTTALQRASHLVDSAERFLAFGTTDLKLIFARIRRGLLGAQALETMLQNDPALLKDHFAPYPAPHEPGSHKPGPRPALNIFNRKSRKPRE